MDLTVQVADRRVVRQGALMDQAVAHPVAALPAVAHGAAAADRPGESKCVRFESESRVAVAADHGAAMAHQAVAMAATDRPALFTLASR